MPKSAPTAATAGAVAAVVVWTLLSSVLSAIPEALRFMLTLAVFTFGPGAPILPLVRDLSRPARVSIACGFGVAASAVLADVLARCGAVSAYPYVAAALAGAGVAMLARAPDAADSVRIGWRGTLVALVALATGAIAFANRVEVTRGEIGVFGDYDSVDLGYYAAITSELTHRVPPRAPFYSGHALNYSWYPQLLLAMVHRFGDVAILSLYFKLAWPAFLALAALCGFLFVQELAGAGVACLALLLILLGGDFSWIVAWFFTPDTYLWDWLLWPTNFLAPTMEVLHFSTWTPSLPVMFAGLFALARQIERDDARWGVVAAVCFATLVQFKPFAFAILIAGCLAAALAGRLAAPARRQLVTTAGLSVLLALPFVYHIASLYTESRSRLTIDLFLLPRTMLDKLNLTALVDRLPGVDDASKIQVGLLATPLFFAGGFGMRWLGIPEITRAAFTVRPSGLPSATGTSTMIRVLAWMVLAGVGVPFVVVTEPYHDTIQFYQTALYLMWVFTAIALMRLRGTTRTAAIVMTFALALPPSLHFLQDKWRDNPRHGLAGATRGEQLIAEYLRGTDREATVLIHDRPADPSLLVILSERRALLAWARYVTGSDERRADVDRFFASADGDPQSALETLKKYGVTHVIVRRDRDRVHAQVLARLRQVLGTPEAALYDVP